MHAHNFNSRIVRIRWVVHDQHRFKVNPALADPHAKIVVKFAMRVFWTTLDLFVDASTLFDKFVEKTADFSKRVFRQLSYQPFSGNSFDGDITVVAPVP